MERAAFAVRENRVSQKNWAIMLSKSAYAGTWVVVRTAMARHTPKEKMREIIRFPVKVRILESSFIAESFVKA